MIGLGSDNNVRNKKMQYCYLEASLIHPTYLHLFIVADCSFTLWQNFIHTQIPWSPVSRGFFQGACVIAISILHLPIFSPEELILWFKK